MPPYPAGWSGRGRLVCRSISNTEVESPLLGSIPDRHSWMKKAFVVAQEVAKMAMTTTLIRRRVYAEPNVSGEGVGA